MRNVYLVQSNLGGTIAAANTKEKAKHYAEIYANYECWNCSTEIVYHEASLELGNGERIYIDEVEIFASKGKFAKVWSIPKKDE